MAVESDVQNWPTPKFEQSVHNILSQGMNLFEIRKQSVASYPYALATNLLKACQMLTNIVLVLRTKFSLEHTMIRICK